jgi:hypothetical protein
LGSALPEFQTPELQKPPNLRPAIAVNSSTDGKDQDVPVMPLDTMTNSQRNVRQQRPEVNESDESSQRKAVAASSGSPDGEDGDDEDDNEGDMPWWLWLLLAAGVLTVVSWLRR